MLTYNKAQRDMTLRGTITMTDGAQISLSDADIVRYNISPSIGSAGLPIGSTSATAFTLELDKVGKNYKPQQFDNAEVHMQIGLMTDGEYVYSEFGVWYVNSCMAPEQSVYMSLFGDDALSSKFEAEFVDDETAYPSTIGSLAQLACVAAGIPLRSNSFPNAAIRIDKMPNWASGTTLRDVLSYCAICAGGFAMIALDGKLDIVSFADGVTHEIGPSLYQTFTPEGGTAFSMNAIEVKLSEEAEEYTRFALDASIPGNATNTIRIDYNPLITQDIMNRVLGELTGISMVGGSLRWGGDPAVRCGDFFSVTALDGSESKIMVTSMTTTFVGGMGSTVQCDLPSTNTVRGASYSTANSVYDSNGNIRAERVSGLDGKIVTATAGHFERLTADQIVTDRLVAAMLEAIKLRADEIDTGSINTDTLTAIFAGIVEATIEKINAGVITTDQLYTALAKITDAQIKRATIDWAQIGNVDIGTADIKNADIDWAHIKDLVSDTAIITQGVGGELYIARLAVTEANMVSLTVGELIVKGSDGGFYSLGVDADGNVTTTLKQVSNDDVADLSINGGEKIIEGSITAAKLNVQDIFADSAIIRQLIAANIDVDTLFAREVFTNEIIALADQLDLSANTSVNIMIKDNVDEATSGLNADIESANNMAMSAVQNAQNAMDAASGVEAAKDAATAAQEAANAAQDAAESAQSAANATETKISTWFSFSDDGLETRKAGSTYSTLVDETGFHVLQLGGKIGSFAKRQLETEAVRIGRVGSAGKRMVMREAADGGIAFVLEGAS